MAEGAVVRETIATQGLGNLGNTCYFNTVVQCLNRCADLRTVLRDSEEGGSKLAYLTCPQLRWLYLVLDDLRSDGALALANALSVPSLPSLEVLWCCGAFSAASSPGDSSTGFRALTQACDDRPSIGCLPLSLELEHGFSWGDVSMM